MIIQTNLSLGLIRVFCFCNYNYTIWNKKIQFLFDIESFFRMIKWNFKCIIFLHIFKLEFRKDKYYGQNKNFARKRRFARR